MAYTEIYIDPSLDSNTGDGSLGDPFGDLQYAFDNTTRDTTNGDRFNVKTGTDEVLGSGLSLTNYGTPSTPAPLCIQGYSTAANDGSMGGIDADAGSSIFTATNLDAVILRDMHLHNCGANQIIDGDDYWSVINCEIDNTSAAGIALSNNATVLACHIHNCGARGIILADGFVAFNYLKNDGSNDFTAAIDFNISNLNGTCIHNIISVDGTTDGILIGGRPSYYVANNTLFSTGNGKGITLETTDSGEVQFVGNNIVEGWSVGIEYNNSLGESPGVCIGNVGYDNDTDFTLTDINNVGDNESLAETPFEKSGSDTYANRVTYWAPKDVGNVTSPFGGLLGAKGAVQFFF